jgi:hypothetical protein
MKTWRITPEHPSPTEFSAEGLAQYLWETDTGFPWAEAVPSGEGECVHDIPAVRNLLLLDPVRIAHAYLKHSRQPPWLFGWVGELCQRHPVAAWPLVCTLVDVATNDEELAFVAAGPIEDLLRTHGPEMIERVEAQATASPRFRRALSGVWRTTIPRSVWDRMTAARRDEPGIDD